MQLVESLHINRHEKLIEEIFASNGRIVNEDFVNDVKMKAAKWASKIGDLKDEYLPALQKRYETLQDKMKNLFGSGIQEEFDEIMSSKAGTNWKADVSKLAAAVAVASSLISDPASAQSWEQRLGAGIVGGLQHSRQNAPGYYPHKDPRVVSGELTPEQGWQQWQQQQMSGQQIPQQVLNALIGGALTQFSIRKSK
jgi:hypothetical protein